MIQKYSLRRGFDSDFTKKCGNYYNQPIFVKGVKATYFVVYKNELVRNLFLKQYNSKLPTHSIIFCSENENTFVYKKKKTRLLPYILVFLSVIRQITLVDNFIRTLNIFAWLSMFLLGLKKIFVLVYKVVLLLYYLKLLLN
jgi:hypothetical protein